MNKSWTGYERAWSHDQEYRERWTNTVTFELLQIVKLWKYNLSMMLRVVTVQNGRIRHQSALYEAWNPAVAYCWLSVWDYAWPRFCTVKSKITTVSTKEQKSIFSRWTSQPVLKTENSNNAIFCDVFKALMPLFITMIY